MKNSWMAGILLLTGSRLTVLEAYQTAASLKGTPGSQTTILSGSGAAPESALVPTEGLFTILQSSSSHLLLIKPDQWGRPYLFSTTLEKGTGENGVYSTMMGESYIFYFRKAGGIVQLVRRNTNFRAREGAEINGSVASSFQDSIISAAEPVGPIKDHPDMALVSLDALFLSDLMNVATTLGEAYPSQNPMAGYKLDLNLSQIESVENFPDNIEILASLQFVNPKNNYETPGLPSAQVVGALVRYSLSNLPDKNGFEPRPADDRVGHFVTPFEDYSKKGGLGNPDDRVIHRWRLEKINPQQKVSEVKKPIVYYLDKNMPMQYRGAVAAGVLAWNKAFEKLGYKNAIEVRQQPKNTDWKAGDIRFNMIRWFVGRDAGFAIGPSRVNPLTGEIFHASISISDQMPRSLRRAFDAGTKEGMGAALRAFQPATCDHAQELMAEKEFALAAIKNSGRGSRQEAKKFLSQFMTELTAHEVGHTLGLRHNFIASTVHRLSDLNRVKDIGSSVMDYNSANIAPKGARQGRYFMTEVGPYDEWAIEYAYSQLQGKTPSERKKELDRIAARSAGKPQLAYATDEDLASRASDPRVELWDLGKEPLKFRQQRIDTARKVWARLENENPKSSDGYKNLRTYFNAGIGSFKQGIETAVGYLGAVEYNRNHYGDRKKQPYEPVSAERQRQALKFLDDNVFKDGSLDFSPKLIRKLAPENLPTTGEWVIPQPFPAGGARTYLQQSALDGIFSPAALARVDQNISMSDRGKDKLAQKEIFDRVAKSIWSELDQANPKISASRRELQLIHLNKMAEISSAKGGSLGETQVLATRELENIGARIEAALKRNPKDEDTRLHLQVVRGALVGDKANGPAASNERRFALR